MPLEDARRSRRALESAVGEVDEGPRRRRREADDAHEHVATRARQLTNREWEVLELLVDGAGGGDIADRLGLQPNTVRSHVQSILTKLGVHSRLEAAGLAARCGLIRTGGPDLR